MQSYADQAEVDAKAYTNTREAVINTAWAAADTAQTTSINTAWAAADAVETTAMQLYADTAETDAIASAESKDGVRATAAASDATTKANAALAAAVAADIVVTDAHVAADAVVTTAMQSYADQAEADAESAAASDATSKVAVEAGIARAAEGVNATAIATEATVRAGADTTLQSNIDTENARIDAILLAADADKDTFVEIVTFINAVDTTNDTALGTEIGLRVAGDTANEADATTKADAALAAAIAYHNANDTDTVYSHPTHPGDDFGLDTGALTGATVVSDIDINVTTDGLGHVTDANGTVATRTLTLANLGYTGSATANDYSLPASVVHESEGGALHASDAISISGHTITLTRGNGATETVVVPDNNDNTTYTAGNGMTLTGTEFLMSGSYTGNFTATGDVTAYSDDSLKTNVQVIDGALGRVEAIRGVTFDRIEDGSTSTGVIAQELKAVLPEAVHTDADGIHSVAYGNITGLLIEAIKELSAQVEVLKAK